MVTPSKSNVAPSADSAFYDQVWSRYAKFDSVSPAAFHRRRLIVSLASRYAAGAASILDVGCGSGELLEKLGQSFPHARLAGADVSERSLMLARDRCPKADFFTADLTDPGFEHALAERLGRYDLVVCSEVLEHLGADTPALQRVSKFLAGTGHLVLTVPGGKMSRFDRNIGHVRHYGARHLERIVRDAGLTPQLVWAWGFPFQNLYRALVRVASRFTLQDGRPEPNGTPRPPIGQLLGGAYALTSHAFKPLFYLNLSRWGEQLVLVAERHERRDSNGPHRRSAATTT